jgi:hypothetical protein
VARDEGCKDSLILFAVAQDEGCKDSLILRWPEGPSKDGADFLKTVSSLAEWEAPR